MIDSPDTSTQSPFKVHGLWAPGVVLMRNLSFSVKARVIAGLFFVPSTALWVWLQWAAEGAGLPSGFHPKLMATARSWAAAWLARTRVT